MGHSRPGSACNHRTHPPTPTEPGAVESAPVQVGGDADSVVCSLSHDPQFVGPVRSFECCALPLPTPVARFVCFRGAQVDAPSDLVAWVHDLVLSASAQANLLQSLTGDSFGATGVKDLLNLEPDDIDNLKATLPKLSQKAFVEAIAALKVALALSLTLTPSHTHTHTHTHTCACVHTRSRTPAHMNTHAHPCTHTYAHAPKRTHAQHTHN